MKKITKYLGITIPVVLVVLAFLSSAAFAEGPECEKKDWKKHAKEQMIKDLGLTEEQQAQLSENRKTNQTYMKEVHESLKSIRSALREELGKYNSDPAKVQNLATEIKSIQAKLVDQRIATISKVKEILTAEQFEKFQAKIESKREAFKKGHGKYGRSGKRGKFHRGMKGPEGKEGAGPEEGPETE